jgi:hypothetical protein
MQLKTLRVGGSGVRAAVSGLGRGGNWPRRIVGGRTGGREREREREQPAGRWWGAEEAQGAGAVEAGQEWLWISIWLWARE